jgi:DNA-directed RNA polymerase subunit RPC12/RpoP
MYDSIQGMTRRERSHLLNCDNANEMSSGKRKLTSPSPEPEGPSPAKRVRSDQLGKCVFALFSVFLSLKSFCRPSKHCSTCGNSYTSERSHRAVCTRQEVPCVYPDPNSGGRGEQVVLRRVNGFFKCIRCGKELKKDQGMKVCLCQESH